LRLLSRDVPDIQDARAGIADVIKDAHRANRSDPADPRLFEEGPSTDDAVQRQ
jgi:hypothetical protein